MNVYVLTSYHPSTNHTNVMGVFKTPKAARKHLDSGRVESSKGKWEKSDDQGLRFFSTMFAEYTIKEWMVS